MYSAGFSPDGTKLISASGDKSVRIWDSGTGAPEQALPHESGVNAAEYSLDGRHIVSGSDDTAVRLWSGQTAASEPEPEEADDDEEVPGEDSTVDRYLATAATDGAEWGHSKIMYLGPGRVGKSHLHRNVAGKQVQGPLASTVGMDAVTLECAAMRTGVSTGQWSQHQDSGASQVVQALAAACAN